MSLTSTIRLEALDGTWETLGVDRLRGYAASDIQATAGWVNGVYGSDTLSFTLQSLEPGLPRPDLLPFTPIEFWEHGQLVWAGRVRDTPIASGGGSNTISVNALGWQYHLDDDVFRPVFVHTRMSDWTDVRNQLTSSLSHFSNAFGVQTSGGGILLTAPANTYAAGVACAAMLDLGPEALARRVIINYTGGGHSGFNLAIVYDDDPSMAAVGTTLDGGPMFTVPTTVASTPATPSRYVALTMDYNGGGGATGGDTAYVRINFVYVFTDTAYESANASILKAADVVKYARGYAPLLTQSNTLITGGSSFSIPSLAFSSYISPREAWVAANALEDDVLRIGGADLKTVEYFDKATAPGHEIGSWAGSSITDAGPSGDDIYNRVVVEGTGPDDQYLAVTRNSSNLPTATMIYLATAQPTNPGFEVNTTGWTATLGTITRDTGVFDSGVASGRVTTNGANQGQITTLITSLSVGRTYRLRFRFRSTANMNGTGGGGVLDGTTGFVVGSFSAPVSVGVFSSLQCDFTPTSSTATFQLGAVSLGATQDCFYVDAVELYEARPTIPDRRGFNHSKIYPLGVPITSGVGTQIADLALATKTTTPFRGSVSVNPGGVRSVLGGSQPHPSTLLRRTGEMLRLAGAVDPQTGAFGRDGRMIRCTYDASTEQASVELDNTRAQFETLLNRYGAIIGGVLS